MDTEKQTSVGASVDGPNVLGEPPVAASENLIRKQICILFYTCMQHAYIHTLYK